MKLFRFFCISVLVVVGLTALFCAKSPGGPSVDQDATGTISGTIVDASGGPLSGVAVTADSAGYTTVTDTGGHYTIPYVKQGTYALTFTKANYKDTTVSGIQISRAQSVKQINMVMRFDPIQNFVEHDVYGALTGDLSQVSKITATITGDSIDPLQPLTTMLVWLPVSQRYTGFVYLPKKGILWTVQIKVYDSLNRMTGYKTMLVDAGVGDISMPDFAATNAKPIINAGKDTIVSINDSVVFSASVSDSFGGFFISIAWDIGNTGIFSESRLDTFAFATPDTNSSYKCILRAVDNDSNVVFDTAIVSVVFGTPQATAGVDTVLAPGVSFLLSGSRSIDQFGKLIKYEWQIGNSGLFKLCRTGDTTIIVDSTINCILRITDDDQNQSVDTIHIFIAVFRSVTNAADFSPRRLHSAVVFNNKMWVIAGEGCSDVWSSADGINWDCVIPVAAFPSRSNYTSLVFDNRMWVLGGSQQNGNMLNDVWYSTDGIAWFQATATAQWIARSGHTSLVFNDKMWIIGGVGGGSYQTDVWSSIDGITWVRSTANAEFPGRSNFSSIAFNNKMWIIAGNGTTRYNDVWSSPNGITWTKETTIGDFQSKYGHASVVFNDKMWIIAGLNDDSIFSRDVLYSKDGKTWIQAIQNSGFPTRAFAAALTFNNAIYVLGGQNMGGSYNLNDVWMMK